MSRRVIVDQDNFEPGIGMTLDNEDIVERDGYRDTEHIVNEFISAGERLAQFRKEEFDRDMADESLEMDVTRSVGFEVADASMILESEAKRIASLPPVVENVEEVKKEENKNGSA